MSKINHWLIRVGDGKHLETSSKFGIWGFDSSDCNVKSFMGLCHGKLKKEPVKEGDILWFIKGGSGGQAISCAEFEQFVKRIPGVTMSDTELGWDKSIGESNGNWDYEIRFKNYKEIEDKIYTKIKAACTVRRYNENCLVNLPAMYDLMYNKSDQNCNEISDDECSQITKETNETSSEVSINSEFITLSENIIDIKNVCLDIAKKMDILIEILSKKA
jgi:hypothetical protein